jgi:hypothetical protein
MNYQFAYILDTVRASYQAALKKWEDKEEEVEKYIKAQLRDETVYTALVAACERNQMLLRMARTELRELDEFRLQKREEERKRLVGLGLTEHHICEQMTEWDRYLPIVYEPKVIVQ